LIDIPLAIWKLVRLVNRERGFPAVVGTESGTEDLCTEQQITVSYAEGETGFV